MSRDNYPGITITAMVRLPLTPEDHERGRRLGRALRQARGARSMTALAAAAGVPVETLRKIESGRVPTPAFFTVSALSTELGLSLDDLALTCATPLDEHPSYQHEWDNARCYDMRTDPYAL